MYTALYDDVQADACCFFIQRTEQKLWNRKVKTD